MSHPTPPHETAAALGAIPHAFFGRLGGVSPAPFDTLNPAATVGDDADAVAENRARCAAALKVSVDRLVNVRQIHSPTVVTIDAPFDGDPPEADALVTTAPGLALSVFAADCAPVLLADPGAGVVAAAHAGWRGALAGVLPATVAAMVEAGAQRARIAAAVGPCIGQAAYEVGPEFVDAFHDADPENERFFKAGRGDRSHFDLKGYAAHQLADAGVETVALSSVCTYTDHRAWFSYRRARADGCGAFGRNLSAIALES